MHKIFPFLWFDHQAEEAVLFYTSSLNIQKSVRSHATAMLDPDQRAR